MKKSPGVPYKSFLSVLLVAWVISVPSAAQAQSSLTVYGRFDLGMSQTDTNLAIRPSEDRARLNPLTDRIDTLQDEYSLAGAQDRWTDSRLGFRGTEDLGGGLRASFVYELGINADRNTPAGVSPVDNVRTRLANLSLSSNLGTVVVGTFMNPFDAVRSLSPSSANIPGGGATQWQAQPVTERFDSRSQNSIAYTSPAFRGFSASLGFFHNTQEARSLTGLAQAAGFNYRGFLLGVGYQQGPWSAHLAYGNLDLRFHTGLAIPAGEANSVGTLAAPVNTDVSNLALGVSYNLRWATFSFIYEDSSRDRVSAALGRTALPGLERNMWELGVQFPRGSLTFFASYGQGERTDINVNGLRFTDELSTFQFGATYHLSRRTWLYAAFGESTRQFNRIDLREESGYSVGLVHTF